MRRVSCVGVVAALALSASACSIGAKTSLPSPTEPAVRGGELKIGIVQPISLDPALAADSDSQLVVSTMCDPIVEIDPATGTPTAGMTKHVVYEEGGVGVTITLKDGLRFSDGKSVSVADVRAGLSRLASDTLASPLADEVRPIAGFELVHGDVKARSDDDPNRTTLLGVTQVTKKVFTIALAVPDPEFPLRLARPWSAIVPRRASLDARFGRRPVCVGPYRMIDEWKPGDPAIVLERNPFYTGSNEIHTSRDGYPDRITFRTYVDREAVHQAFVRGEVDVARVSGEHMAAPPTGARVTTAATPSMEYLGLPNVGVLGDAKVRAALSAVIDRPALLKQVGRLDRIPATGLLPPTMVGAPKDRARCAPLTATPPDVAVARELLAGAGTDLRGIEVPVYFNDDPGSGNRELMEAVGAQWQAALGVVPKLMPMGWEKYRERGVGTLGFDGPFRSSWRSPTPAPVAFLRSQFAGSNVGSSNLTRFSSPSFDLFFTRGLEEETDQKARARMLAGVIDVVCSAVPVAPLWSGTESFLVRDTISAADGRLQRITTGDLNVRELYLRKPQEGR